MRLIATFGQFVIKRGILSNPSQSTTNLLRPSAPPQTRPAKHSAGLMTKMYIHVDRPSRQWKDVLIKFPRLTVIGLEYRHCRLLVKSKTADYRDMAQSSTLLHLYHESPQAISVQIGQTRLSEKFWVGRVDIIVDNTQWVFLNIFHFSNVWHTAKVPYGWAKIKMS